MTGTFIPPQGRIVGALTDGTGISPFGWVKFIKDFVADVLLSGATALVAVQIVDVGAALATPRWQRSHSRVLSSVPPTGLRCAGRRRSPCRRG